MTILEAAHAAGHVVVASFDESGRFVGFAVCADPREGDEIMIEVGRYRMRGVEAGGDTTEKGGHPFVEVMCEITSGPHAAMRVKYRGYLNTEDNAKRTLEALRTLGWKGRTLIDLEALRGGNLHGIGVREVIGTVQHDLGVKNDREVRYPKVAFVNAVPTVSGKTTERLAVAYDLDGLVGAIDAGSGDAKAAPPSYDPATGEVNGDDDDDDFPGDMGSGGGRVAANGAARAPDAVRA
jgi:hypothetical protein